MLKQLSRAVFCSAYVCGITIFTVARGQTLVGLFEAGREAFLQQDYPLAVDSFSQLQQDFSGESEFLEPTFHRYFLSMYGVAALLVGDVEQAKLLLTKYLSDYYEGRENDATQLLALIQATRLSQESDSIDGLYRQFLRDFPSHPDFHLIQYQRMLSCFELGSLAKGLEEMEAFCTANTPPNFKFRAQLTGLQQLLSHEDYERAGALLLNTRWDVSQMPEMAVLAISALKIADYYMELEDWNSAIEAFRWVPFYRVLIESQKERLCGLEKAFRQAIEVSGDQRSYLWRSYYRNLMDSVKSRLVQLEQGEDYTPSFVLKYGRSHLFNSQYAEAWVLFRSLALTPGIEGVFEEQAWYHWILASHGARSWEEARSLCHQFSEYFPESELLPKTYYLLVRTHQELRDYRRANEVLDDLLQQFSDHEDRANWLLTRGFNYATLDENELALNDFESIIGMKQVESAFRIKALYWRGVTLSAMHEYDESLSVFESLIEHSPDHWMFPEFQYRRAMVLYSKRDYESAEHQIVQFLSDHEDHFYASEAKVLLGDIAMGLGQLNRAVELFAAIDSTEPKLFMYAFFQIGKIYKAQEAYKKLETHYRGYLDVLDFKGKARTSEALYWLGWSLTQQGRELESIPLYLSALDFYGNNPLEGELIGMIQALETLKKKQLEGRLVLAVDSSQRVNEREKDFLQAETFESWLANEMEQNRGHKDTYVSRLRLYEALKLRNAGNPELARSAIQGISLETPIEAMDDQLLGEIGLALAEDGFGASSEYLRRLLVHYPSSAFKSLAYLGFAAYSNHQQTWEDALKWLVLLEKEFPNHSRMIESKLLRASVLTKLEHFDEAAERYNDVLKLKQARGSSHVKALFGLACLHEMRERPDQAIPYYQRIYTLYRAYRPFVAKAYLESARLFESMDDVTAAYRTWVEFSNQLDLAEFPEWKRAESEISRLEESYGRLLMEPDPEPIEERKGNS